MNNTEIVAEKKLVEAEMKKKLAEPANSEMVNRIIQNIHMDLIPYFKDRVQQGFTVEEALELEEALNLCDRLPNMNEERKKVVTMSCEQLKAANAIMRIKVQKLETKPMKR